MTPAFSLSIDGASVAVPGDRLLGLTVTDEPGLKSDKFELKLDDRDNAIALPRRGATVEIALGYLETGLTPMGRYTVDEVVREGPPWTLTVSGKAADMRESFKRQKTRHFEDTTLGAVLGRIAADNGLTPAIDPAIASRPVTYAAQTEESDLHFATRLARRHDALVKPAGGRLVATRLGDGRAGSGKALAPLALVPGEVTKARVSLADRPRHGKVEAEWFDRDGAQRKREEAQAGDGEGPVMKLPHPYPSQREAKNAAEARARELARAGGSLSLEMPGRPDAAAERPLTLTGFPEGFEGEWTTKRVEHALSGDGFETKIEGERKPVKGEAKTEDDEG